jgi:hypothetical protein
MTATRGTTTATLDRGMGGQSSSRAVNTLDCGDGRGIAGATTTTMKGGPGNVDVKAVDRFERAGRLC